jgi:hypothetical protein
MAVLATWKALKIEHTPMARATEHYETGLQDVAGVNFGDAVVDDVGVERRQIQVADRLDEAPECR